MTTQDMVVALDEEISRLRKVRELLSGFEHTSKGAARPQIADLVASSSEAGAVAPKRRRGRPKKAVAATSFDPSGFAPRGRTMSPEGRARIAAAQRARWAKKKDTEAAAAKKGKASVKAEATSAKKAAKKSPAKKTASTKRAPASKGHGRSTAKGVRQSVKGKSAPSKGAVESVAAVSTPANGTTEATS